MDLSLQISPTPSPSWGRMPERTAGPIGSCVIVVAMFLVCLLFVSLFIVDINTKFLVGDMLASCSRAPVDQFVKTLVINLKAMYFRFKICHNF